MAFLPSSHRFITNNAQSFQSDINLGNPDLIWSYTFGTNSSHDAAYSAIRCSDGGYLITGSTSVEGTLDVILIRLNETGELEWTNIIIRDGAQTAQEAIECESGGYAIIGYTQEQLPNGTLLDFDAYLVRIYTNGSVAWTQTIGTNASQQAYSIVECLGGFAFVGYTTNSERGDLDFWFVRTTDEGEYLWNQTYGSDGNDICYSIVYRPVYGEFVLAGSRYNIDSGSQDGWVLNIYYDGSMQWDETFGGTRNDIFYDIILRAREVLVIVGITENLLYGGFDAFVLCLHANSSFLWNTTIGGFYTEEAYSITWCQSGGYAITGFIIEQTQLGTKTHLWVARLDSFGNVEWNKRYGGVGKEIGWSIIQTPNHDFIIAGTTEPNQEDNVGTDIWVISVPDTSPLPVSPNFELIFLGITIGVIIITLVALIFTRSKRSLRYIETRTSKRQLQKSFILPRTIEELTPIISGYKRCRKCGTISDRKEMRCPHCSELLHRCLFCDNPISNEDVVIFCPGCRNLSHAHEMLSWLKKRDYCPRCGFKLKKS